jgi:hypothetical protein
MAAKKNEDFLPLLFGPLFVIKMEKNRRERKRLLRFLHKVQHSFDE